MTKTNIVTHQKSTDDDFFAELTRSRGWKITRSAYRHVSLNEIWVRAYCIFMCSALFGIVLFFTIEAGKEDVLWLEGVLK
jgi:hypothetical protein